MAKEISDPPEVFNSLLLGDFIGVYDNKVGDVKNVVFFSEGLAWFENSKIRKIRYDEMRSASVPHGKHDLCVSIELISGEKVLIPITGTNGKFFDTMQVIRFILRVVEDLNRK